MTRLESFLKMIRLGLESRNLPSNVCMVKKFLEVEFGTLPDKNCHLKMATLGGMGRNGAAEMARAETARPKWRDVERARKISSWYFNCLRPNGDIYNGTISAYTWRRS